MADTPSGDLPQRLRETWPLIEAGPVTSAQRQLAHDAAAEIERLRADLDSIGFGPR